MRPEPESRPEGFAIGQERAHERQVPSRAPRQVEAVEQPIDEVVEQRAFARGALHLTGGLAPLAEPAAFAAWLAELREGGFTRVSFGMQSAVDHVLRTLDRTHDPRRVPDVVAWARRAGFEVTGRDGRTLSEHWADGMRTLHGIHVRGFPNLLFVQPTQGANLISNVPHNIVDSARTIATVVRCG